MTREGLHRTSLGSLTLQVTRIARKPLIYSTASIGAINISKRHFLCLSPHSPSLFACRTRLASAKVNGRAAPGREKVYIIYIPNMFEAAKRRQSKKMESLNGLLFSHNYGFTSAASCASLNFLLSRKEKRHRHSRVVGCEFSAERLWNDCRWNKIRVDSEADRP